MLIGISQSANCYVQMSALDGEPYGDSVDNGAVAQLMEMGYENFVEHLTLQLDMKPLNIFYLCVNAA